MNDVLVFESLFLIFLFANLALGFYLYLREAKSIKEHRNKVPHVFSGLVSLDAHKAASDARLHADKVNEIRHLSNLVLVLLLTFGGGITWFSSLLTNQLGNGLLTQILFALCVGLAFLVINGLFFAIAKNPEKNSSYLILRNFGSTRSKVSNIVFFVLIVSAVLTCWSVGASYWWILAWVASAVLVIGASVVSRSIAYFAHPLSDEELKSRLDKFLKKVGFESEGVFAADSDRLGSGSGAFISGFGSNKKVVLTESLIERLNPLIYFLWLTELLFYQALVLPRTWDFLRFWCEPRCCLNSFRAGGLRLPLSADSVKKRSLVESRRKRRTLFCEAGGLECNDQRNS